MIDLSPFRLVIFDKDGTLIDFDAMWGGWAEALAVRLEAATGRALAPALFAVLDYDAVAGRTIAGGRLAVTPMTELFHLTGQFLKQQGLSHSQVDAALGQAWFIPDPAGTAKPLVDLPRLFGALRQRALKIAIATSDDRAPTLATLASLGVAHLVDTVVAADDDVLLKPEPDMVWAACRSTRVEPRQTIVVGDAVLDMQMARAAGAGLAVGVASGVSSADLLAECADAVLADVDELLSWPGALPG